MNTPFFMISEDQMQDFANKMFEKAKADFESQEGTHEEIPILIDEAAKIINLSKPTIYGLVHKNDIPHSKKGKRLYFLKSELIAWINSGKRCSKNALQDRADTYLFNKRFK